MGCTSSKKQLDQELLDIDTYSIHDTQDVCIHIPKNKKITILIVDDMDFIIKKYINKHYYKCKTMSALSGNEAIQIIYNYGPRVVDIILMNIFMINCDGYTATEEIRSLGFKGLIIGMSGFIDSDCIYYAKKSGMNNVCLKPLDLPKLFKKTTSKIVTLQN